MENLDRQNKKLTQSLIKRGVDPNNFVRVQDLIPLINELETEPLRYKALITPSPIISTTSGLLEVGKTYNIKTLEGRDDFSNVGYITDGEDFVATETTPTEWAYPTTVINITDSQPVVSVLENSLSITVTLNFRLVKGQTVGVIELFNPNSSLPIDKTFFNSNGGNLIRESDNLIVLNATDIIAFVLIEVYP